MAQRGTEENGAIIGNDANSDGNAIVVDDTISGRVGEGDGTTGQDYEEPAAILGHEYSDGNASGASSGTASASADISARTGKPKRKYTPRGSASTAQTVSGSLTDFGGLIFAIHEMAGAFLHCPEIELDENEAKKIAKASRELMGFYQVELSPEKVVWANFAGAMIGVYGPRAVAIGARKRRDATEKKAAPRTAQPATVASDGAFPARPAATVYDFTGKGAD